MAQDKRLIDIFDKYGLKATFNLNSQLLGLGGSIIRNGVTINHTKNKKELISKIYKKHEIAARTLPHSYLLELEDDEIIRQVEEDRKTLEKLSGKKVVGLAYPCGGVNFTCM